MDQNPRLRLDLEIIPVSHQGRRLGLVRDHLGLAPLGAALPEAVLAVLPLLDGTRSGADIQARMAELGLSAGPDQVDRLINDLESCFLLDTERFRRAEAEVRAKFAALESRPCSHAGSAYPARAGELKSMLDKVLSLAPQASPAQAPKAVVAPHIDIASGARTYARAYSGLSAPGRDRVLVLGVGHQMADGLFSVTAKDFETPLGVVENDRPAARALIKAGGPALAPDDFGHRSEHSVEFQALFLKRSLGDGFSMVPVLCGSLRGLAEYSRRAFVDAAGPFLKALAGLARDPKTLVVAGVDLSHIGPKFGHEQGARDLESEALAHDARLLERLVEMDVAGFWAESARVKDRYNVCGFAALACLLEILPSCQGRVLDHDLWREPPTNSAVS
ncbi:MAG: AmmeMemoRadiSam system protein B, partial [Desulfovibrionaceae bacterium]|nr:AmmeMemoRadiSam system protein B [Desulfovibrionaceae bacterium]